MHHPDDRTGIAEAGLGSAQAVARPPAAASPSWDPYEVWLTRVKEPRERSARTRTQERLAVGQPVSADLGDTARLRILSPAP